MVSRTRILCTHGKVTGKKIILMDDYHTTGATLKEMTNILIEHQPTEIFIIVLIKVK